MQPTVLITGGTGLIGTALTRALVERQFQVIILTRDTSKPTKPGVSYAAWDIETKSIDRSAIEKADYIIHLAGAGIADRRWSEKRKAEIINSRVNSSALLVEAARTIPNKIKAVVSASAIGWYGEDRFQPVATGQANRAFVEPDPPADDFLGQTCLKWEESIEPMAGLGKRLVKLRTGIVLSKDGGALPEFKKPLKMGVAAILGSGKQIVSWIHINDLVNMYINAITLDDMHGVYNAVSPNPVTNKELVLALAKKRGKFYIPLHVPGFVLKIVLGEMSIEVLKSARVSAQKIVSSGFEFAYPLIDSAIIG